MPAPKPSRPAPRTPSAPTKSKASAGVPQAAPASSGMGWLAGLALGAVLIVAGLVAGGLWMQSQRADAQAQRQQAALYQRYLQNTEVQASPDDHAQRAAARAQAQSTRQYLTNHPAVTPGSGFEKPGVQSTGLAIVRAIDNAKGL